MAPLSDSKIKFAKVFLPAGRPAKILSLQRWYEVAYRDTKS